ncbi:protease inhibitor I42 family protein [Acinetobacter nectaris]|uniref:protease inhibitor I42 family protein n=1 Tax=Acinetobacter nectaris TaxID=1219382 RepID=UPI001F48447D|nr:protease inhibitor I42 family protein [Acinetobacter nectaris]MCF8999556.1 protease inhibitor I42 family protein [Acinetobacter nectaris]MCF9027206.1 protease inhibitor I42 family protein [Acinetobacter nectaris]
MKYALCISALCMGLLLVGCYSSSPTVDGKTHVFTLKQKCPALLEMKVGQSLMFHAPENPSTGYQWQLVEPLKLFSVDEEEQKPKQEEDKPLVGQTAEKIYQFDAEQQGEEEIRLVYVRPWEKTAAPAESWQCRVRIS